MSYENNSDEPENVRKIFIGGLSRDTTDDSLKSFYEKFGDAVDCIVMKDAMTKRSRGFGFVTYKSSAMVNTAMDNRPHVIDGKTVDPKRAVPREEGQRGSDGNVSSKRLYVANVRDLSEDQLREYFSKYGGIEKIDVIIDKITNQPRGFCFITFDDYDPVDKCVLERYHMIGTSRCEAKKGLNKEEQNRAQMSRDRMDRFGRSRGMGRDMGGGRGGYQGGYGGGAGGYQQYGGYPQQYPAQAGYGGDYAAAGYGGYGGAAGYGGYGEGQWGQQGGYENAQWGQGAAAAAWGGAQGASGDGAANAWGGAQQKY
ncbi:hypothetical protein PENTCL1PPCAC_17841 [Pristionchus entomophagus]|uniref:RRM domain-containing protein n=1 Tax=Pristionchus entomophagus TaxID=358040 RepID=A0AAV5TMV5_9BILA|nr:hypothetical protein PENTCL1PPCAC_17841 [Pristionchus entomophagus]